MAAAVQEAAAYTGGLCAGLLHMSLFGGFLTLVSVTVFHAII
jgi:hypothetical protein